MSGTSVNESLAQDTEQKHGKHFFFFCFLSFHLSSVNSYLSSPDSGPSRSPHRSLAGRSRCSWAPLFPVNNAQSERVCSLPREEGEPPGRLP